MCLAATHVLGSVGGGVHVHRLPGADLDLHAVSVRIGEPELARGHRTGHDRWMGVHGRLGPRSPTVLQHPYLVVLYQDFVKVSRDLYRVSSPVGPSFNNMVWVSFFRIRLPAPPDIERCPRSSGTQPLPAESRGPPDRYSPSPPSPSSAGGSPGPLRPPTRMACLPWSA